MTPENYFEKLSSLILTFTHEYRKNLIDKIIPFEKPIKEPEKFFYVIIHKSVCSLEAANIFVRNFDSRRDYHIPLFLILRTVISDILTAEHITHCSKTDEHAEELIEEIYFDHLHNVIKACNSSYRHLYQWNSNEYETQINSLKKQSRFYDDEGNALKKHKSKSLSKLISEIYSSTQDKDSLTLHRRAYDLYSIYSKFEHLGELSFYLLHRSYDNDKQNTLRLDLYDSINFIISGLMAYKKVWSQIEHDSVHFENLQKQITEMHPKNINIA